MSENNSFPCSQCGLCCRLVYLSPETSFLNRGDGICRHLNTQTNLCTIYADRPLVCRVRDYYKAHYATQFTWEEFVALNVEICNALQAKQEIKNMQKNFV